MVQNILVILFIGGATVHILYGFIKTISRRNISQPSCGGCTQCELKKKIIRND